MLAGLFSRLLRLYELEAQEVFEHIREASQKRAVLSNLAKHNVKNVADRKALESLLEEYQRLAGVRAKYVHARWLVDDLYPNELIWVRRVNPNWSREAELVDENVLANVADEIDQLRRRFHAVVDEAFIKRFQGAFFDIKTAS